MGEATPQFRNIYIEDVICRGARTAVLLQGLPEMPIRGIHLRNVSITSETGMIWMDAENIAFENGEIANSKGPVLSMVDTRNAVLNPLTYPAGAEVVIKAQGNKNSGIAIHNTDLKSAQKDFILTNGATAGAFQVK